MADDLISDIDDRSLFLIQVRYLEEKLESYQIRCDELEKANTDVTSQYSALEKDKKKITEHLKHSVAAKEKKIDELVKLLESQQQIAEKDRETLELQLSQELQELQEQINTINLENKRNVDKIEELKVQSMQLMQHLQNLESVKKRLVNQKEENDAAIHKMKTERESKKARLLEDVRYRMDNLLKAKILDVVEIEMAHYRKCMEQLEFLQGDSMLLLKENDALQKRNRDLCVQRDNLKENFEKIKQTIISGRKDVVQLSENCQQLKVEQEDWRVTHQHKVAEIKGCRQSLSPVLDECRQKTVEIDHLRAEIEMERIKSGRLEDIMQDAAIILRHLLMDSGKQPEAQMKARRVLEILQNAAFLRNGPDPQRLHKLECLRTETTDPQPQISKKPLRGSSPHPRLQSTEPNPVSSKKAECV